jgi:pimeloyl-ACP methyl ester carboxylesterase
MTTYPVQFQKILFDSVNIAYIDEGTGSQTILFVHGLGHSYIGWQKNIDYLKQYYRCIAIDLPGNGRSTGGNYPYSMIFFAECLYEFIKSKNLKNVILCGHSMGGQIAMSMAYKHPESIERLVLCAPAGFELFNDWEKSLYRNTMFFVDLVSNEENSLRKAVQNSFYIMPDTAPALVQQLVDLMKLQDRSQYRKMLEACISAMLDEPVYGFLSSISMPVLVIFGERDNMIPNRFIHPTTTKKLAEKAVEQFPNATLEMIGQCGHFVQWEKAVQVNGLIRSFAANN